MLIPLCKHEQNIPTKPLVRLHARSSESSLTEGYAERRTRKRTVKTKVASSRARSVGRQGEKKRHRRRDRLPPGPRAVGGLFSRQSGHPRKNQPDRKKRKITAPQPASNGCTKSVLPEGLAADESDRQDLENAPGTPLGAFVLVAEFAPPARWKEFPTVGPTRRDGRWEVGYGDRHEWHSTR